MIPFDQGSVADDTRRIAEAVRARIAELPSLWTADHARSMREAKRTGSGGYPSIMRSPRAQTISIPSPDGDIALRVVTGDAPKAVYLHVHGGGWFMGAADLQDEKLTALADDGNLACVSVDYRLAPDHLFPAALDDCVAVAHWLAKNARRIWGTEVLVIGGDSSGAHLAALTLLRTRGSIQFACAHLIFGFFDLSLTPGARLFGETRSIPRSSDLRGFVDAFLGPERDRRSPELSPLYSDLVGLCPAGFVVGTEDALLDDSLFMHARWLAAGNVGQLLVYPGAPHNFVAMPCRAAADAHASAIAFIKRWTDGAPHLPQA